MIYIFFKMSTKIKTLLIENATHLVSSSRNFLGSLSNMHVSYQHNESIFTVNLSCKDIHKLEKKTVKDNEITFSIKRDIFIKTVLDNLKNIKTSVEPKKVVIDFSSPNIAKPFHVGHLRSTIIGNFIANINTYFNNEVIKINYLGDWGTQFGFLQYGIRQKNLTLNNLSENPIRTLYEVYVEANKLAHVDENVLVAAKKYFSDIEHGRTSLDSWKQIREITVQELENVYQRLGITFNDYHWESDYNGKAIRNILEKLIEKGIITTDSTGKKVAQLNNRNVTVLKSDDSTLYLSRDIAALLDRYNRYKFDKMLYVVDNSQTDHFAAVFDIVGKLDKEATKGSEHIKFGRIKGMSTRSGNVVFLNDILDEAKQKMYDKQQESKNTRSAAINEVTCDVLGTTAVLINDLKQRRQKDYTFNWNRALQSEGDSGIKLQYLHCRLWSLEKKSGINIPNTSVPDYLKEEIVGDVVNELARFEDILNRAWHENEACIIVNYLFRLSNNVNRMFNELKVKNVCSDVGSQRLLVFHSARFVIKTSLEILGVKPLCEM